MEGQTALTLVPTAEEESLAASSGKVVVVSASDASSALPDGMARTHCHSCREKSARWCRNVLWVLVIAQSRRAVAWNDSAEGVLVLLGDCLMKGEAD